MNLQINCRVNDHIKILICLLLVIATILTYWNLQGFDFIDFDDELYVTANVHVQSGLNLKSIQWALTTTDCGFWHPLTFLSLMLDYQLFGLNPGGFHWTSLLLHVISTVLLFWVLNAMTGSLWRSAFAAALFALHPLHVEAVASIAQRKDTLSTVFWMLTMYAYFSYVTKPGLGRYVLVVFVFILGLMSKPMLVTLPFVLFLLDFWPLNRFKLEIQNRTIAYVPKGPGDSLSRLILEKLPLVILSIGFSSITYFTVNKLSAITSFGYLPLLLRLENAVVSYIEYISKMIIPVGMTVSYPHPGQWPLWLVFLSVAILVCTTFAAIYRIKKYPYFCVGWFWYLGTLVPVIGLIQVGSHAMADRYTYIPLIGLFIMISWGGFDLAKKLRNGRVLISVLGVCILVMMAMITRVQVGYWKDSITLFDHAIKVTEGNYLAHNNLGVIYFNQKKFATAFHHLSVALKINPDSPEANRNMAALWFKAEKLDRAIVHLRKAIKNKPDYRSAIRELADILAKKNRFEEAVPYYRQVLLLEPNDPETLRNLAVALARSGKVDDAITEVKKAINLKSDYEEAKRNLDVFMRSRKNGFGEKRTNWNGIMD